MRALVIKSWLAGNKPIDEQNNFVSIVGRSGGSIAWLLSLFGIDPTTRIIVGSERVEFTSSSLAGTESRFIPLEGICSSYYGYHKPWKNAAALIGIAMLFGASIGASVSEGGSQGGAFITFLIITGIGAVIALVHYFLNCALTLGFVENSGIVSGIRFKRSVIENVDINETQAKTVCIIIQRLIEDKQKRSLAAVRQGGD